MRVILHGACCAAARLATGPRLALCLFGRACGTACACLRQARECVAPARPEGVHGSPEYNQAAWRSHLHARIE